MVLFGPPGTGKTSIAEDLAATLKWTFIEITPSDFVASGVSAVELRAKEIFTALTEQEDAVILLDEIDRLILDRDSRLYQEQGDMFQVLTPGMLPKLKQLRSRQRSIFILATNYKERLEPAAIRIGRIDKHFLVGLPDLRARENILAHELNDEIERSGGTLRQDDRMTIATIAPADLTKAAESSALAAYGELCELVRTVTDKLQANGKLHIDTNQHTYFVRSEVLTQLGKRIHWILWQPGPSWKAIRLAFVCF